MLGVKEPLFCLLLLKFSKQSSTSSLRNSSAVFTLLVLELLQLCLYKMYALLMVAFKKDGGKSSSKAYYTFGQGSSTETSGWSGPPHPSTYYTLALKVAWEPGTWPHSSLTYTLVLWTMDYYHPSIYMYSTCTYVTMQCVAWYMYMLG